jgi:hypothetical protein
MAPVALCVRDSHDACQNIFGGRNDHQSNWGPASGTPQPFLPEGPRSAAVGIVVKTPRDIVIPGRRRLRLRTGLEVAVSEDCSLEIRPIDEEQKPAEIWPDCVPPLVPVQRQLLPSPSGPFTPIDFDVLNRWDSAVGVDREAQIAAIIMHVHSPRAKTLRIRGNFSNAASSSSHGPEPHR